MTPKRLSLCFNPHCKQPQNLDETVFCHSCGSCKLLANRYQAIKVLGQGGGNRTLLVVDRQTSFCVIKQFWSDTACFYPNRSIYELSRQAFQSLEFYSQIPQGLEQFEQDNILYLVQEYIPGDNLAIALAQKGTFNTLEVWQILESLLLTISHIHNCGVIHGDIKPENIICRGRGNLDDLVLVNGGIAKLQTEIETLETALGSPVYAAPEQVLGKPVFECDLYSLGVTSIYLLTGIHPFSLSDASGRWVWRDYWLPSTESNRETLAQFIDCLITPGLVPKITSAPQALKELYNLRGKKIATVIPKQVFTGKCQATILGHSGLFATINAIAFNHSQILASASDDKTIHLWNQTTLTEQGVLLGHTHHVKTVTFDPQFDHILVSGSRDRTIKIWDVQTLEATQTLTSHEQGVNVVIFSSDGQLLISGSADKQIKLWDYATKQVMATLKGHTLAITALACNNSYLASASADKTVKLWSLATNELIYTLTKHTASVQAVAFNPNGNYLATAGSDRTINLWDTTSGQHKSTLSGHPWAISALAFSSDGETLISSSWDKTIKLWNVSTGKEIGSLTGHTDSISCMAVDAGAKTIFTGSSDRTIKLWNYL
jgi:Protein kinase domain/WD domain, G-beta repeat